MLLVFAVGNRVYELVRCSPSKFPTDVRWFMGTCKIHSVEQEFSAAIFFRVFLMEKRIGKRNNIMSVVLCKRMAENFDVLGLVVTKLKYKNL